MDGGAGLAYGADWDWKGEWFAAAFYYGRSVAVYRYGNTDAEAALDKKRENDES